VISLNLVLAGLRQASSGNWQQTLTIHPNSNRGTETQQSTSEFDANGNLLVLNNIGTTTTPLTNKGR
jgi:hypothetical protein